MKISVSILDCDFLHLEDEIRAVEQAGADAIHLDVMDGKFVPTISFGPAIGRAVRRATGLPIHTHLMVADPGAQVERFCDFSDLIIFHIETVTDPAPLLAAIRKAGCAVGLSINPHTPLVHVTPWLGRLDDVLVMSVVPGKGGQQLIPAALDRVRTLRAAAPVDGKLTVSIDGGVNPDNAARVREAGADIAIAGSAIYKSDDYPGVIRSLKQD
jgi:ribulose-phosphate 3-epimerase